MTVCLSACVLRLSIPSGLPIHVYRRTSCASRIAVKSTGDFRKFFERNRPRTGRPFLTLITFRSLRYKMRSRSSTILKLAALEQMESIALPGSENRTVTVPRLPVTLSMTPQERLGAPPTLGEHGLEILKEANYTEAEIAELVKGGICELP